MSCKYYLHGLITWIHASLIAVLVATINLISFGKTREWSRQYLMSSLARQSLQRAKIDLHVEYRVSLPQRPCIFVSNHTSGVDIFAIATVGLPQCFYFLSRVTFIHLPLTALALLNGVFYLPLQNRPLLRAKVFRNAAARLKQTGKNVFLTPEGARITTGSIGHFNKGAFHLAIELQRPIVCIYVDIRAGNGLPSYSLLGPAKCRVTFFDIIEPPQRSASIEEIERLRDECRKRFLEFRDPIQTRKQCQA